jgi:hypothetical protein
VEGDEKKTNEITAKLTIVRFIAYPPFLSCYYQVICIYALPPQRHPTLLPEGKLKETVENISCNILHINAKFYVKEKIIYFQ